MTVWKQDIVQYSLCPQCNHRHTWKKRAAENDTGQCGGGTDTFEDAVSLAVRMRSNPNKGSKDAALGAESMREQTFFPEPLDRTRPCLETHFVFLNARDKLDLF